MLTRRDALTGLLTLVCAPAVIRVAQLMPIKALPAFFVDDEGNKVFEGETFWWGTRQFRVRKVTENNFVRAEVMNSIQPYSVQFHVNS